MTKMSVTETKTALVTGSTSGIGLCIAHALAKRGVGIIITGFEDRTTIDQILTDIKRYGVRADYISADLTKTEDIEDLWSQVLKLHPNGIDILVNNAGFWFESPVEKFPDEKWNQMIAVMLSAPFHLIKRCLPKMKNKGWGRIVNMSSSLGLVGLANISAYLSAKHGLIGLTKGVALENASHGITCNAVCPDSVQTPLFKSMCDQMAISTGSSAADIEQFCVTESPTGKLIQPEQVAELVEFLCLSNASSQMTGASYLIDSGYTAK